jgi:hypothetical protein
MRQERLLQRKALRRTSMSTNGALVKSKSRKISYLGDPER